MPGLGVGIRIVDLLGSLRWGGVENLSCGEFVSVIVQHPISTGNFCGVDLAFLIEPTNVYISRV
jgi:hypothetical protein